MRANSKPIWTEPQKGERLRRVRLGQVRKVFRHRYGYQLPDDDAGREELRELLLLCSLHPTHPIDRMRSEIEVWAPWMPDEEGLEMINNVVRLPVRWRMANKVELGKRLNLTDYERRITGATSIMPVDMSEAELKERSLERERERKRQKRRMEKMKPRRIYESESASKNKPWAALGISRATYYRYLENGKLPRETSVSATMLRPLPRVTLVSARGADRSPPPKGGGERAGAHTTTVRPADNDNRGCLAGARPVSGEDR